MPSSTKFFKKEIKDYILEKYDENVRILDVGAGIGTYANLLKNEGYTNIDCVEVFKDYIIDYKLEKKYKKVYNGDITKLKINFNSYDLIILGDVLEHIEEYDAVKLLKKLKNKNVIVTVPFESPQGEHFGNIYEIHLQDDLTFKNFFEKYDDFYPLCLRYDYGVFVRDSSLKIYIERDERQLTDEQKNLIDNEFFDYELIYLYEKNEIKEDVTIKHNKTTIVTALWDLGRGKINESFSRKYDDYLNKFSELLKTDIPMYIFADKSDEEFIWKYRKKNNTVINFMSLDELKKWFNFTNKTNEIRKKQSWLNQSGWLKDSPQATLEGYNPLVMSKMFMLNNVTIWNPFMSDYFFWIDAGITNTVHYGYFTHDKVFEKLPNFLNNNKEFVFLTYPYEGGEEIHGFGRKKMAEYCEIDYVKYVCRGGFFGGTKKNINEINGIYYHYLNESLNNGYMGTEESIFTIIQHVYPELSTQYTIDMNGLVWPFFEDLKNNEFTKNVIKVKNLKTDIEKTSLYVIGFNSPNQFETLISSMIDYDRDFIEKPKKYLLNNSTDDTTLDKYQEICDLHNFIMIKPNENLGICGGRQFIAEHFDSSDSDFMFFFEDDMFFYSNDKKEVCKNGFNRVVNNLYEKSLKITQNEKFDFLKLNFSEFFGDNSTQWSWYNVPQNIREKFWPDNCKLPEQGLSPNAPKTVFKHIKSYEGVPYVNGEIYYCNWPQVVSKEGNKKMFLTTKWAYPYEQTWMSYMYQETKDNNLNPGMLLLTPTEHNRFDHYNRDLRKES